jgi:hypothetical protein
MIKVKGVLLVTMLPIYSDWLIILKKPNLCAERIREIEIRLGDLGAFPPFKYICRSINNPLCCEVISSGWWCSANASLVLLLW